jgi:hypothetical protein
MCGRNINNKTNNQSDDARAWQRKIKDKHFGTYNQRAKKRRCKQDSTFKIVLQIFNFRTVKSSKTTTQSTTEKPGKGRVKVNATTPAPKKEGELLIHILNYFYPISNLVVTTSTKATKQSTTEKPGKGKLNFKTTITPNEGE